MSRVRVAAVVADTLSRAGVARVFVVAGAPRAVIDAVRSRGLDVVETHGVMAACIMAAVTGELADTPGVAIVSMADGVTAAVDGAAHAGRDRAPVIVISDATADSRLLEPVVKASVVADAASAAHWSAHAVQAAMAYPRGAVHLAIPDAMADAPAVPVATAVRRAPLLPPAPDVLDALGERIAHAARPVLVTGLEIAADDVAWIRALAESLPAPVLTTAKGKGALPDPHPLALGLLDADHPLLAQADVLVVIGVDPVELAPRVWPAAPHVVRITRSPQDDAVVGDIALVIEELAPRLRDRAQADWDVAALDRLKRQLRASARPSGLTRRRVIEIAREMTPAGTILALDVPLADAWQSVAPRECLIPNGVATHGFTLPAAVAAALARAPARVIAIGAAAGFAATPSEWPTVMRLGVAVIAVALNHAGASDVATPARAAGIDVLRAADEVAFRATFERAWRTQSPTFIDAHVR